ncbi:MarR family transcriptional regulator [Lentibacillus sp. L22]|uniref:MarR family winged helix-turn-helix transcriptional regulator n=1 Tax=Lentibacillus TaxID=175304 RepID=UPI0022B14E3A|nr:MarR family transcriptional regulator [Lentibacillus daqui]
MDNFYKFKQEFVPFQCRIVSHHNKFNVDGITSSQYNIIDLLERRGPKTTRSLSEELGISLSAVSKLVKKLIDKSLIIQERDQNDRRSYHHTITEKGHAFLRKAEKSRNEVMELIHKTLTKDELVAFTNICKKLNQISTSTNDEEEMK